MYINMSLMYINQIEKPRSTSEAVVDHQYGPNPGPGLYTSRVVLMDVGRIDGL